MKTFLVLTLAFLSIPAWASPVTTDYIYAPDGLTISVGKGVYSLPSTSQVTEDILTKTNSVSSIANKSFDRSSNVLKQYRMLWDYAASGGVVGSYSLGTLPAGCLLTKSFIDVITAPGSSVASTIAFGSTSAGDILAATSFSNLSAGLSIGKQGNGSTQALQLGAVTRYAAATPVSMVVASNGLSAGKIALYLDCLLE